MEQQPLIIRGKRIAEEELIAIRRFIEEHPEANRTMISREVCTELHWLQPNGNPQDVACREILRRLEQQGLIHLPAAKAISPNAKGQKQRMADLFTSAAEFPWAPEVVSELAGGFSSMRLEQVRGRGPARVWAEMMSRHHYLGYSWSVGRSIKYLFYAGADLIGGMSWGSACWKLGSRDELIGWDAPTREKNLQGMAGNHRFLILPWVKVKNLASHLLSRSVKQLPVDWKERYGVELYLLESFVDPSRFQGTCYKAANWIYLGQSKGSSKSGNAYVWHGQVKDIYVYPLRPDYQEKLRGL